MIDNTSIKTFERETTSSEGTKSTWWWFSLRPQLHTLFLLVKTHIGKHILIQYTRCTHIYSHVFTCNIHMFLLSLTRTKNLFQKLMKRVTFPDFSSPVEVLGFILDPVNLSFFSGLSFRPLAFWKATFCHQAPLGLELDIQSKVATDFPQGWDYSANWFVEP